MVFDLVQREEAYWYYLPLQGGVVEEALGFPCAVGVGKGIGSV